MGHTCGEPNEIELTAAHRLFYRSFQAMFYTRGYWNQTQSAEVTLAKGKNTLKFTRLSDRDVMYKEFFLYTKKPDVYAPRPVQPQRDGG